MLNKANLLIEKLSKEGNHEQAKSLKIAVEEKSFKTVGKHDEVQMSMAEPDGIWVQDPVTKLWYFIYV